MPDAGTQPPADFIRPGKPLGQVVHREAVAKQLLGIVALGLGLTMAPAAAEACRIRQAPPPINPENYDAIAIGTAIGNGADIARADLRVDEIVYGQVDAPEFHLSSEFIIIPCYPMPQVAPGGRVIILLDRGPRGQSVGRWVPIGYAEGDPFLALYLATEGQAARRRLVARWRQVIRFGGPVPRSDPGRWLAPAGGWLGRTAWPRSARVEFGVGDDGRVTDCRIAEPSVPTARDAAICANLARRRFERPLLPAERRGAYEVRWDVAP